MQFTLFITDSDDYEWCVQVDARWSKGYSTDWATPNHKAFADPGDGPEVEFEIIGWELITECKVIPEFQKNALNIEAKLLEMV